MSTHTKANICAHHLVVVLMQEELIVFTFMLVLFQGLEKNSVKFCNFCNKCKDGILDILIDIVTTFTIAKMLPYVHGHAHWCGYGCGRGRHECGHNFGPSSSPLSQQARSPNSCL